MKREQRDALIVDMKLSSLMTLVESALLSDFHELKQMYLAEALSYIDEWQHARLVEGTPREDYRHDEI